MEAEAMKYLAAALAVCVGAVGSALAEGKAAAAALEGMSRNPQIADKLFTNMVVAIALCESTAIYCLVVSFIILFVA